MEIPEAGVIVREVVCNPWNIQKCKSLSASYRRLVCYIHVWMARRPVWECVCIWDTRLGRIHAWPTGLHSLHLPRWQSMISYFILVNGNHSASLLCFYESSFSHKRLTIFQGYMLRARPSSDWFNDGPSWRIPRRRSLVWSLDLGWFDRET